MRIILLIFLACLYCQIGFSQSRPLNAFIGLYHTTPNYGFVDSIEMDSALVMETLPIGNAFLSNQAFDHGFNFRDNINACVDWHVNQIFGILEPASEGGIFKQPADTVLNNPFDILQKPGMVQGAARFSSLSKEIGQVAGVILDDWDSDIHALQSISDALNGKILDAMGNIDSRSPITTPDNQLFVVKYDTWVDPIALPFASGVSYWYFSNQNCCYQQLDSDIVQLRKNWVNKDINIGVYIRNSKLGWTDPVGVSFLLQNGINQYDDGAISGITLFAGHFLTRNAMSFAQWKQYDLKNQLQTYYQPFIGWVKGNVKDCRSSQLLDHVNVKVYSSGRLTKQTYMRGRRFTDNSGVFDFSLWAGNRNTDSTYHWVVAEKKGYQKDSVGFWVHRNKEIVLPSIQLCAIPNSMANGMAIYPNPFQSNITVQFSDNQVGKVALINPLGIKLFEENFRGTSFQIWTDELPPGCYFISVENGVGERRIAKVIKN